MQNDRFRKESLDHLASPERLDSLMVLVRPRSWISLGACLAVILAGVAWGLFGHATDEAVGPGILAPEGGFFNVDALATGTLSEVLVKTGSIVAKGEVVARVVQEGLEQQVREALDQVGRLKRHRSVTQPLQEKDQAMEQAAIMRKLAQLKDSGRAAKERVAYLEGRVKALKAAADKGIVTEDQYRSTVQELAWAQDTLAGTETSSKQLAGEHAALVAKGHQATFDLDQQITRAESELSRLRTLLAEGSEVRSPMEGRVTEILMDPGERVNPGLPILRMENTAAPVVVYLFLPAAARWLVPGKRVEIELAGFPREEFGAMVGAIHQVSPTPQSLEAVQELSQNHLLAQRLAGSGDTYKVEVIPEPDSRTYSHYRWTNGKGPQVRFGEGDLVTGRIQIRQERPVEVMVPFLKRWLALT